MSDANHTHAEELDLAIPDMDSETAELAVKEVLKGLPGIESVRLMQRGAWIRHHANTITGEQICDLIRHAGFRPSIFQDSAGRMGRSSQ